MLPECKQRRPKAPRGTHLKGSKAPEGTPLNPLEKHQVPRGAHLKGSNLLESINPLERTRRHLETPRLPRGSRNRSGLSHRPTHLPGDAMCPCPGLPGRVHEPARPLAGLRVGRSGGLVFCETKSSLTPWKASRLPRRPEGRRGRKGARGCLGDLCRRKREHPACAGRGAIGQASLRGPYAPPLTPRDSLRGRQSPRLRSGVAV